MQKPPLIAVVGPNTSGKTSLSIKLAKKFDGEIISADSRQVYKGMNIGTGKATKQEQREIKHYLLDVASPKKEFNVSHFKKQALAAIEKIQKKDKLPFLVGGTGFWIQAVVDDIDFPHVKPNKKLRRQLAKKTAKQLFQLLKKLDPKRAKTIDKKNYCITVKNDTRIRQKVINFIKHKDDDPNTYYEIDPNEIDSLNCDSDSYQNGQIRCWTSMY